MYFGQVHAAGKGSVRYLRDGIWKQDDSQRLIIFESLFSDLADFPGPSHHIWGPSLAVMGGDGSRQFLAIGGKEYRLALVELSIL